MPYIYELLRRTKLIIGDEILMQHKHCFTSLYRTFTNLMNNKEMFDGISVVLDDEFAQILPVVRKNTRSQIVDANLQQCFLGPRFKKFHLRQNMQIRIEVANQNFANGFEKMFYKSTCYDRIQLFNEINNGTQDLRIFTNWVFPPQLTNRAHENDDCFKNRAILTMHNDSAAILNKSILNSLQRKLHTRNSANKMMNESQIDMISSKFLRILKSFFLSSAELCLKIEAFVMLLRNMYSKKNCVTTFVGSSRTLNGSF